MKKILDNDTAIVVYNISAPEMWVGVVFKWLRFAPCDTYFCVTHEGLDAPYPRNARHVVPDKSLYRLLYDLPRRILLLPSAMTLNYFEQTCNGGEVLPLRYDAPELVESLRGALRSRMMREYIDIRHRGEIKPLIGGYFRPQHPVRYCRLRLTRLPWRETEHGFKSLFGVFGNRCGVYLIDKETYIERG